MKHLFKLKKDGKTVGYLQLRGGVPSPETAAEKPLTAIVGLVWYNAEKTIMAWRDIELQWDTAHPFVTKDKTGGKDVFADDLIRGIISDVSSDSLIGKIIANESPLSCWMFKWKFEGKEYLAPAPDLQDIELIEDKEDE